MEEVEGAFDLVEGIEVDLLPAAIEDGDGEEAIRDVERGDGSGGALDYSRGECARAGGEMLEGIVAGDVGAEGRDGVGGGHVALFSLRMKSSGARVITAAAEAAFRNMQLSQR